MTDYEKNEFFLDGKNLTPEALAKKHRIEQDPSARTDHMKYMPDMEVIQSDMLEKLLGEVEAYDPAAYTAADVRRALDKDDIGVEDFKALLSPAAAPFLEEMAVKARNETGKHFGNTVYIFTPLYLANYCEKLLRLLRLQLLQ